MNRDDILARFPWLAPHAQPELVVIGDDLDSALTAALYLHQHPQARLVGVYGDSSIVYHATDLSANDLLKAVWLDLDIYHRKCRSLGHQVLRLTEADALSGLAANCNLNDFVGCSVARDFWRKYPLGTVHFLLWLYGLEIPNGCETLIWLADAAYINGQASAYKFYRDTDTGTLKFVPRQGSFESVETWLRDEMPVASLLDTLPEVDEEAFEWRMAETMRGLCAAGFPRGEVQIAGQPASRHLQLHGFQCQAAGAATAAQLARLVRYVSDCTGWQVQAEQVAGLEQVNRRTASRATAEVSAIQQNGGLDHFLEENKVFSYVFPNRHTLTYTFGAGK